MIEMETHIKPAVTLGKVVFGQEVVDELIEEVETLRNSGDNAGDKAGNAGENAGDLPPWVPLK